jgi:hypothetical protein
MIACCRKDSSALAVDDATEALDRLEGAVTLNG